MAGCAGAVWFAALGCEAGACVGGLLSEAGWLGGLELPGWADCAVLAAVVGPFGGAAAVAGAAVCCPDSVLVIASPSSIPAKTRISVEIVYQGIAACRVRQPGEQLRTRSHTKRAVLNFIHIEG